MKKIMILIILTGLYITLQGCIQNEALYSPNVTELEMDAEKIEMLKLDKQYLLASNGKKCLLEINTH